jgi:hypothetical protein
VSRPLFEAVRRSGGLFDQGGIFLSHQIQFVHRILDLPDTSTPL